MSTGNPLEQLRRRMQSQATPTAFVALAEEHRRAGRFGEAIAACRDGLERYPAYVSARVALGRALLDSGDVAAAVTELEHAVAQSPDNLAAARALEAAHAALGDMPCAAPAPPAVQDDSSLSDLPLRAPDAGEPALPASLVGQALGVGADGPQEFGLGPDWSIPDAPPLPATGLDTTASAGLDEDATDTLAPFVLTESPALHFTPPHPQGEEHAGIWPVPACDTQVSEAVADGAPVYAWALGAPAENAAPVDADGPALEYNEPVPAWDDRTIESPLVGFHDLPTPELVVADVPSPELDPLLAFGIESRVEEARAVAATANEGAIEATGETAPADGDEASAFWGGVFGGEPAAADTAAFAGWGEDAPPTTAGADRAPWSDDESVAQAAAWTVPLDGPSATWALGDRHEDSGADVTPFQGGLDPEAAVAPPFASLDVPVAAPQSLPGDVAWAGSVKSALGEVFALAAHGESLEPPTHASPAVRAAMADAAVEAAREDPTLGPADAPPTLTSLQQMLDAVRARRAALFSNVEP